MAGCITYPGVDYWYIASSSREMDKKYIRGKPETQGEWKLSLHLEIFDIYSKNTPCCSGLISWSRRACGVFLGEHWLRYTNLHFSLVQLSVLANTKIVGNDSSSINMKNYHNIFSHLVEYVYHYRIEHLVYILWVNIGWDMLISISHDSDSVSWWPQNTGKMALAP